MKYLFYIEGLNLDVWISGEDEAHARNRLWNELELSGFDQQDKVVQIECIDVEKEPCNHVWEKVASSMAESQYKCTKCNEQDWR